MLCEIQQCNFLSEILSLCKETNKIYFLPKKTNAALKSAFVVCRLQGEALITPIRKKQNNLFVKIQTNPYKKPN